MGTMSTQTHHPERATLTVPAAARLLGISRRTAYALAARGELPGAFRVGGRVLVSKAALERLLSGDSGGQAAP
jgi:excisionase family DNA binding protein